MPKQSSPKSKKVPPPVFEEVYMLHYDMVVEWEAKDMCSWLQKASFYSASAQLAIQSAVLAIVNPSVCPSVCHTLALCQNNSGYDHAVFSVAT